MESTQEFSAKRATRNAFLLMMRSAIGIVVGLFTSRIVYNALGVEDYGINAVVAGIIPAFTFITAALSTGTSRFLTYEIGRGDEQRVRETFTAAFWAHLCFALIFVAIAEVGGVYLLRHGLDLPEGRETASMIALQCSIVVVFFDITQTPYNAVLVANERFNVYAYYSLFGTFFGLATALIVKFTNTDRLVLYVLLGAVNNILVTLLMRNYCLRHHSEAHLKRKVQFKILRPIFSYSLWNLFGNTCTMLHQQSRNYLVNIFFGVRYNASTSVATTVHGAVGSFSGLFGTAFFPQITKQYAQGNIPEMERVIKTSMRFSLLLMAVIAIPCMLNAEEFFRLWLGSVPPYAPFILRSLCLISFGYILQSPFRQATEATGKIRVLSIVGGLILLLQFVAVYCVYQWYHTFTHGFVVLVLGQFAYILLPTSLVKRYIPQLSLWKVFKIALTTLFGIIISLVLPYIVYCLFEPGVLQIIMSTIAYACNLLIVAYGFLLSSTERTMIKFRVKALLSRYLQSHHT